MFTMFQSARFSTVVRQELVPFTISLFVAQIFFKFGSFAPELVAFLATWFALSAVQARLIRFGD